MKWTEMNIEVIKYCTRWTVSGKYLLLYTNLHILIEKSSEMKYNRIVKKNSRWYAESGEIFE